MHSYRPPYEKHIFRAPLAVKTIKYILPSLGNQHFCDQFIISRDKISMGHFLLKV